MYNNNLSLNSRTIFHWKRAEDRIQERAMAHPRLLPSVLGLLLSHLHTKQVKCANLAQECTKGIWNNCYTYAIHTSSTHERERLAPYNHLVMRFCSLKQSKTRHSGIFGDSLGYSVEGVSSEEADCLQETAHTTGCRVLHCHYTCASFCLKWNVKPPDNCVSTNWKPISRTLLNFPAIILYFTRGRVGVRVLWKLRSDPRTRTCLLKFSLSLVHN